MKNNSLLVLLFLSHIASAKAITFAGNNTKAVSCYCLNDQKDTTHSSTKYNNTDIVHIGLTAGLNFSDVAHPHNSFLTGLNAGITFNIPIEFSISFDAAILYSQKGYLATTGYGNYKQRLNYIDMPYLIKFGSNHNKFNFLMGPQLSFLTSSNQTFDDGFTTNRNSYYYKPSWFNIAGIVGASYAISKGIDLRAKYAIDFNSINSHNALIPNYHNQVFQIGLGFKFN